MLDGVVCGKREVGSESGNWRRVPCVMLVACKHRLCACGRRYRAVICCVLRVVPRAVVAKGRKMLEFADRATCTQAGSALGWKGLCFPASPASALQW